MDIDMKKHNVNIVIFYIFLGIYFIPTALLVGGISHASKYPLKVSIITKTAAQYDTPENAYAAIMSAMVHMDSEWYYEGLTLQSADNEIQQYQKYGVDIQKKFNTAKNIKHIEILDKKDYNEGVYLLVRVEDRDGSVFQGPSLFVLENGFWRSSQEIPLDDPLLDLLEYTPPPSSITPFTMHIFPSPFSISWYNWIKERIDKHKWLEEYVKQITILCAMYSITDEVNITDIEPESIRLNDSISPRPWEFYSWKSFTWQYKDVLITEHPSNSSLSHFKEFRPWRKLHNQLLEEAKPLLLVRFNMYSVMETISQENSDNNIDLMLSGNLKNGKEFRVTANVFLQKQKNGPKSQRWGRSSPPNDSVFKRKWWNK